MTSDPAGKPRLLYAGTDERFVREAVTALSDRTCRVTAVDDVDTARNKITETAIDCLVCDASLSDRSGTALVSSVTESHPSVPVIVLTEDDADVDEAIAAGATDVVVRRPSVDCGGLLARRLETALSNAPSAERDGPATGAELTDLVLDTLNDVFYFLDTDGELARWNEQFEEVTGYSDAQIEEMAAIEFFEGEDRDRIADAIAETLETGTATVEADLVTSDGEAIPYDFTGARLTGPDGAVRGVVGIGRDVSERNERIEKLEQIRKNISEVVWMTDPQKESMDFISDAYADVWGRSPETLRADPTSFVDAIHPEDRDRVEAALAAQREDPEQYEETYRVVQPDGDVRWVHDRASGVYEDGELTRIVGVARDITERKQLEEKHQRKATLLDHIFDQVPVALYVKDEEGRYLRMSDYDRDPEEVLGKTDPEIYGETEFTEATYADDMRVINEGERIVNKEEYNPKDDEWTLTSKVPWHNDDGEIQGLIGVSRYITEKKEYERKLRLRNRAMEEAPVGITIHDATAPSAPITYANTCFQHLTGYGTSAIEGVTLDELTGADTAPDALAAIETALEKGTATSTVLVLYRRHGDPFWARVSVAPVAGESGDVTHFVGFLQDVTDTKEHAEGIERRLDEFGDLLAEEVRTPLRDAEASLQAIAERGSSENVQAAKRSIQRAEKLVDDLATVHSFSVKSRSVFESASTDGGDGADGGED